MLELRPNCECCNVDLLPESTTARICTYECTFCAHCVDEVLHNVCPNCGGGFVARPIRPQTARREGVSVADHPPSTKRVHLSYKRKAIARFVAEVRDIPPHER